MARSEGGRSALLLGSTGLVGRHCLELLLTDPAYARVVILTRRPADRHHPRLEERRVDFDRLDIDGSCSTNDTLLLLASGASAITRVSPAGTPTITADGKTANVATNDSAKAVPRRAYGNCASRPASRWRAAPPRREP